MGLNIYITKKIEILQETVRLGGIKGNDIALEVKNNVYDKNNNSTTQVDIKLSGIRRIDVELAYFRNTWFLDAWIRKTFKYRKNSVKPIKLSKDDIKKIVETCNEILADNSKASSIMSSDEYNEEYFETLRTIVDVLSEDKISYIDSFESAIDASIYYQSSF